MPTGTSRFEGRRTPGPVTVTAQTDWGKGVLLGGFHHVPTLTITGTPHPGGSLTLRLVGEPGDDHLVIVGVPPVRRLETPPFEGTLGILPFLKLFLMVGWPHQEFSTTFAIPDDPVLQGLDVLFQDLVGTLVLTRDPSGAWTNCARCTIQPR